MSEQLRFICPVCETSYTAKRCGVATDHDMPMSTTIACTNCGTSFDVHTQPVPMVQRNWFGRTVLRRTDIPRTHQIISANKRSR